MFTRAEDDVVSCTELELNMKTGYCVSKGGMFALLGLTYKTGNLRYLGGLNGIRGRWGGGNDNIYICLKYKTLSLTCILLLILSSLKPPPVQRKVVI